MAALIPEVLLQRVVLTQIAGAAMAAGGAAYYFTHPPRVVAELPPDLAEIAQDVRLDAPDGVQLHAVWLPGRSKTSDQPHDRTILHAHGFGGSGGLVLARRAFFERGGLRLPHLPTQAAQASAEPLYAWPLVRAGLARGYNFLLADARAHGRSGGVWDTHGLKQMSDLMRWTKWLRETYDQLWVGLWGQSFGAAVGLALATRPAGGGFDAMVLESAPLMAAGLYSGVWQRPVYLALQPVLRQLSNQELLLRLQRERVWMPTLLIHGAADATVPPWQGERAYALIHDADAPDRAALWLVPGADHLESLEVAPDEYIRRTLDWFDQWFGRPV